MSPATLRAIAAHLLTEAEAEHRCTRMLCLPADKAVHIDAAAKLETWARELTTEADTRALNSIDHAPAIEGLTDGPCYCFPGGTCDDCRAASV